MKKVQSTMANFPRSRILELSSANRVAGSIARATYSLSIPIQARAVSLKSLVLPVSWPNVPNPIHFEVVYTPGAQPYRGDFTLVPGNYVYNLYQGTVTYATVNAQPIWVNQNDLVWYILRWFVGAVSSINIDPTTGNWQWTWNSSITTVTSNDASVVNFFKINYQGFNEWDSSGLIDLTGTKIVCVQSPELQSDTYLSTITNNPGYICSVAVDQLYPNTIVHEPTNLVLNEFHGERSINTITIALVDSATNLLLPLNIDYQIELRFWVPAAAGM